MKRFAQALMLRLRAAKGSQLSLAEVEPAGFTEDARLCPTEGMRLHPAAEALRPAGALFARLGARAAAAAFALALALAALCVAPAAAQAEEDESKAGNRVYVNQLSDSSFLYQTSIADLAKADSSYSGKTVLVQGEVVGDRINDELQPENCWITLEETGSSNPAVVSVFMTMEQSSVIDTYGRYGTQGTTLQVRGTFHLECSNHQGMSDIHVEEVSAVASGHPTTAQVNYYILLAGGIAVVIGLVLLYVYHKKREGTL